MNFTAEETWRGGHYEIEFELGVPSDERLRRALQRIWSHPSVKGACFSRDQEPQAQVRVNLNEHTLDGLLYGLATLPNGATAACGTYVCRLQGEDGALTRDFLSFYVPMGALAVAYGISGDWLDRARRTEQAVFNTERTLRRAELASGQAESVETEKSARWRTELDRWLVEIGRSVFESVQFDLALVGWEVDFPRVSAANVKRDGIPAERFEGYLWRDSAGLQWYPPTNLPIVRVAGEAKGAQ